MTNIQSWVKHTWFLMTGLLLLAMGYFEWNAYFSHQKENLKISAAQQTADLNEFLENILESAFSVRFSPEEFKACDKKIQNQLDTLIFNTPILSAVVLTNLNNTHRCPTHSQHIPVIYHGTQPQMFGPVKPKGQTEPYYVLQEQLNGYVFNLIILEKALLPMVKPIKSTQFEGSYIFDFINKKPIFTAGNLQYMYDAKKIIEVPMQMDGYALIFIKKPQAIQWNLLLAPLTYLLIILIFSLFFYFKLDKHIQYRLSLNYVLEDALKQHRFEAWYQPIWSVEKQSYCGVEVLIRLRGHDGKIVMPDTFIELAEQSGLICPITLQLFDLCFSQCHTLLREKPDFHLALNISVKHLTKPQFLSDLTGHCEKYGIAPQQIILELTERELLNKDDSNNLALMKTLRSKGFSLAIDDFGTGHSNLHYLHDFPFNYIKIDKLFTQAIGSGAVTETLNHAIIEMLSSLHLHIISEGVETKTQYDYLKSVGVGFIQGWYFAKAMPIDDLKTHLNRENHYASLP